MYLGVIHASAIIMIFCPEWPTRLQSFNHLIKCFNKCGLSKTTEIVDDETLAKLMRRMNDCGVISDAVSAVDYVNMVNEQAINDNLDSKDL